MGLLLMTYTEAKLLGNKDNQSFQFLEDNFSGTRAKWPTKVTPETSLNLVPRILPM